MPNAMSYMLHTQDTPVNKITYYHLALFAGTLPLHPLYGEVVLISLCVHALAHLKRSALNNLYGKELWMLAAPFFITLLCTLYAPHPGRALNDVGKQSALLLLPLACLLQSLDWKQYTGRLLTVLTLSCTLCTTYLFIEALRALLFYGLPLKALFTPALINHHFSAPLGIHASYLSLYAALSVAWCLYQLKERSSKRSILLYSTALIILLAGLVQLASKTVLIGVALIGLVVYPLRCLKAQGRKLYFAFTLVTTLAMGALVLSSDTFSKRLVKGLREDLSGTALSYTVTDTRVQRWRVTLPLILESPVVGYGSGTEKALLKEAYYEHGLYHSYLHSLNAHNQYLGFLLRSGIIGLALFSCSLLYGFVLALRRRNFMFGCFLILVVLLGFSENYLDVEKGIFFYAFFFTLFVCAEGIGGATKVEGSNPTRQPYVSIKRSTITETVNP